MAINISIIYYLAKTTAAVKIIREGRKQSRIQGDSIIYLQRGSPNYIKRMW